MFKNFCTYWAHFSLMFFGPFLAHLDFLYMLLVSVWNKVVHISPFLPFSLSRTALHTQRVLLLRFPFFSLFPLFLCCMDSSFKCSFIFFDSSAFSLSSDYFILIYFHNLTLYFVFPCNCCCHLTLFACLPIYYCSFAHPKVCFRYVNFRWFGFNLGLLPIHIHNIWVFC